jgi:hypothetical protein
LGIEYISYGDACAFFAVMHIYSAITGKYYNSPQAFRDELANNNSYRDFLSYPNWPGIFANVKKIFQTLLGD